MSPDFTASPPAWVRPYLKIPYRDRNCWQLAGLIALERGGFAVPTYAGEYEATDDPEKWEAYVSGQVTKIIERERSRWPRVEGVPQALDFALYRLLGRWHIATVVGGGWAITTTLRLGSHPFRLCDEPWASRLEGFYRHAGLA